MTSRYDNRTPAINNAEQYRRMFKERGIRFLKQYPTAKLHFPTDGESETIEEVDHIWKSGDRFYKLANKYYGDPTVWWIIAWYNQTPTESHVSFGDIIQIPLPFDRILPVLMREG